MLFEWFRITDVGVVFGIIISTYYYIHAKIIIKEGKTKYKDEELPPRHHKRLFLKYVRRCILGIFITTVSFIIRDLF